MSHVHTYALSTHSAHPNLGKRQGCKNNATLLHLPSHSPWASRALGYAPRRMFSKRICSIRPRSSAAAGVNNGAGAQPAEQTLTRKSFPNGFVFGAATSSYQIEGAWNEDGKGPSVWDHFCHTFPERIKGGSNGDVAVNSYHMYEEDVKMLKAMGMDAYRFSISWSRILPKGTLEGGINQAGIDYYNNLINKLIEYGIRPYVTLFHWDTPQALVEAYGGFLDRKIVNDYKNFADVCFQSFGDRVRHWFTFNEPYVFCCNAYGSGKHAPGRCTKGKTCAVPEGDSLVEPYTVGHHLILAHAEAAHLYKDKYQDLHEGQIGMALVSMGYEPYDKTQHVHAQAQERSIDFNLGWFLEPLFRGDYPFAMRALVKDRLPYFTSDEQKRIVGTYDMMGLNYYTTRFSQNVDISPLVHPSLNSEDSYATPLTEDSRGMPIGTHTGTDWLYSYPEGLKNLLMVIKERYRNPPIYITENGIGDIDEGNLSMEDALNDTTRMQYLKDHLATLKEARELGSNVRGYFTWSLMDNFEWQNGYTQRFGVIYVGRNNGYKRHMKNSARWFAEFNGVTSKRNFTFVQSNGVPVSS